MLFRVSTRTMKMALVVRTDLSMQKGKIASQVAHAAVQLVVGGGSSSSNRDISQWLQQGQPKIVLKVGSLEELEGIQKKVHSLGLSSAGICDAGHTQIAAGSFTVLGIGPAPVKSIDEAVGHLKLL